MTQALIDSGFKVLYMETHDMSAIKKDFNPKNNWFGMSLYEPEGYFISGNKSVLMSLQGVSIPITEDILIKYDELFKARAIKYIRLKDGDNVIYETYTGNLPSKELVTEFLK